MKLSTYRITAILFIGIFFTQCSKTHDDQNTRLEITLADEAGNKVPSVTVNLYKYNGDLTSTGITDINGRVLFSNLEPTLYNWIAESGCQTNRLSETTTGSALVPNAIIYGYSVLSETGPLKVTNNSTNSYFVTSSTSSNTLVGNDQIIVYFKTGPHIIHTENIATPGIGRDTLIQILCADTTKINLP